MMYDLLHHEDNELASLLHRALLKRSEDLVRNNDVVIAAIFLDPRFTNKNSQFLGPEKRNRAVAFITKLIMELEKNKEDSQQSDRLNDINERDNFVVSNLDDSDFEVEENFTRKSELEIVSKISQISSQEFVALSSEFDMFKYVREKYNDEPIFVECFASILSIPSSSASVERLFSDLPIVLSNTRNKLSSKSVSDIMLIHHNSDLLGLVDFSEMNQ
jgi:hypothetical protein